MQNGIQRFILVLAIGIFLAGCVAPTAVEPAKPGDPTQEQQRAWLVGTWYGESRTKDGGKRLEITRLEADGTHTTRFRVMDPSGHVWDQTEVGLWGVSGPVYFTVTKGWIYGKTVRKADPADASLYDAYRILTLTPTRFHYRSLQSGDTYSETKVPATFEFPAP